MHPKRVPGHFGGSRVLRPNEPNLGLWQPPTPLKYFKARRNTRKAVLRRLGAIHHALDLVPRGFFGLFARGFPGFFGTSGRT